MKNQEPTEPTTPVVWRRRNPPPSGGGGSQYDEQAAARFLLDQRPDELDDDTARILRDEFTHVDNRVSDDIGSLWIIASDDDTDDNGVPLYWSNTDGWTGRDEATRFESPTANPPAHYHLPLGECRWTPAPLGGPLTGAARDAAVKAVKKVGEVSKAVACRIVDQDRPELADNVCDVAVVLDAYYAGRATGDAVAACARALDGDAIEMHAFATTDQAPTGRGIVARWGETVIDGIDADWSLAATYTPQEVAQFARLHADVAVIDLRAVPNPAASVGTPVRTGLPADGAGDPLRVARRLAAIAAGS